MNKRQQRMYTIDKFGSKQVVESTRLPPKYEFIRFMRTLEVISWQEWVELHGKLLEQEFNGFTV